MKILTTAFQTPNSNLIWIDELRFMKAQSLRVKFIDKPYISFTDLTSMIVMKELGIRQILTQDAHFMQVNLGFERVPSLEKQKVKQHFK